MSEVWWKNAIGYQIYIRSFFDTNNDGIGDLKGITQKLDYIKKLGINFIWVCPCYDSPMDDNGYDIRNYYKMDKMYGTMNDLKKLIAEAHSRDIKVCLDLVMNHTSDECEWFVKSEKKIEPFTDFYVWKDGKVVDGKMQPPNNWQSFFSGPAWKYSEKRKQYYLKIFSNKMPDINYENETAFSEMEKVIDFYGELGVDGFRVDAIAHIGKDLTFADAKNIKKTYKSFSNLPNTHAYLKRFNKRFQKNNLVTMGELGGDPTKKDILTYTTENELDMVFSFEHRDVLKNNFTIDKHKLLKTLKYKYSIYKNGGYPVLFWLNHDYPRLLSRVRNEGDPQNAQLCLAGLMYLTKGTPIIYNGEELGMENYPFKSPSDFKDVNAKMIFENTDNVEKAFTELKESSRDNSRTVMQWNSNKFAGFSTTTPWTYVNSNYKKCNVEREEKDKNSMLSKYRQLLQVRKSINDEILSGEFKFFIKKNVVGYTIKNNQDNITILANIGNKEAKLKYTPTKVLYTNHGKLSNTLRPYELLVIRHK